MPKLTIIKRKSTRYGSGGMTVALDLPELVLDLLEPQQIAERAAEVQLGALKARLLAGRDATDTPYTLSPVTVWRRQDDRRPPTYERGGRRVTVQHGPFLTAKGRVKKQKVHKPRWPTRFPDGVGSQGGSLALNDSGYLIRNLGMRVDGATAYVEVPGARAAAVNAMALGKHGKGGLPPIHVVAVIQPRLDQVVAEVLDAAFGEGGVTSATGTRFFKGAK